MWFLVSSLHTVFLYLSLALTPPVSGCINNRVRGEETVIIMKGWCKLSPETTKTASSGHCTSASEILSSGRLSCLRTCKSHYFVVCGVVQAATELRGEMALAWLQCLWPIIGLSSIVDTGFKNIINNIFRIKNESTFWLPRGQCISKSPDTHLHVLYGEAGRLCPSIISWTDNNIYSNQHKLLRCKSPTNVIWYWRQ